MGQGGPAGGEAAADGGRTDGDRAQVSGALRELRREWGDRYLIGHDDRGYWAAGRIGTGMKRAAGPRELGELLSAEEAGAAS